MNIVYFAVSWMTFNIILAFIAVIFGWIMYLTDSKVLKITAFVIWFLFVPNTIYLLTDMQHFLGEWNVASMFGKISLVVLYIFLSVSGVVTFVLALYPFEKMIGSSKKMKSKYMLLSMFLLNFAIGIGIVLGRIQRINSWDIIIDTPYVLRGVFILFTTSQLFLALILGVLSNLVYFSAIHTLRKYRQ